MFRSGNQLNVPSVKLSSYEAHTFSSSGTAVWNNLPEYLETHHFLMFLGDILGHFCSFVINSCDAVVTS